MKNVFLLISCSLFSAILAVFIYRQVVKPQQVIVKETVATPAYTNFSEHDLLFSGKMQRAFNSSAPTDFTGAAVSAMPTVVFIRATNKSGWQSRSQAASSGSGVIISPDGYVVTNNHVIENGGDIEVTLNNNGEYVAELIGTDPNTDLALLKIEATDLPYLLFGNSDSLLIGEWVMAVGNPFGLQSTVTAGIVSAKGRNINILQEAYAIESFIQTDAAVNPGNSGGALINTNGELIGINTAIMTHSGRYEGYSFAVPSNLAMKVINDLREYGSVQRGLLGVQIRDLDRRLAFALGQESISELADHLGLESNNGIYITKVTPNSGADEAGLESNDVIVEVNGVRTNSIAELQEQIGRLSPGDVATIAYVRKGKEGQAKVVLKNIDNSTDILKVRNDPVLLKVGFEVRDLSDSEKRKIDIEGVKVMSIYQESAIEKTNMEPGFIITHVNGEKVSTAANLVALLKEAHGRVELDGRYDFREEPYSYRFWKD